MNAQSIEEVIHMFVSEESKLHEEMDWWCFDDHHSYNIHNYGSINFNVFKVDVYPNAEGHDRPDYSTWETVKTFNFKKYKKGK